MYSKITTVLQVDSVYKQYKGYHSKVYVESSIVLEVIKTVLFFYQDILHKNKTHKYLNTPKKHNKAHKLGDICPDKIADKKNNQ